MLFLVLFILGERTSTYTPDVPTRSWAQATDKPAEYQSGFSTAVTYFVLFGVAGLVIAGISTWLFVLPLSRSGERKDKFEDNLEDLTLDD